LAARHRGAGSEEGRRHPPPLGAPRRQHPGHGDVQHPRGRGARREAAPAVPAQEKREMKPINVGLLGIGTVGGGTWDVLERNASEIERRAGRGIRITQVADKDTKKALAIVKKQARVVADGFALVKDKRIDIVVELVGGTGVARELVLEAIRNGKQVVTANKALL